MGDMVAVLAFGAVALLMLAGIQGVRFKGNPEAKFTSSFTKSFGLILVATLGAALVFSDAGGKDANGAYTLLGIIAGYLAGAKLGGSSDDDDDAGGVGEVRKRPSPSRP